MQFKIDLYWMSILSECTCDISMPKKIDTQEND